jgi:DNA-directed RNA polymerase specialized sigma24 family protein
MKGEIQSNREKEIFSLYKGTFPMVAAYISKTGGNLEEAKDIFHDALVIYIEKRQDITLTHSDKSYLFGIAKNLWHYKLREKNISIPIEKAAEAEIQNFYSNEPIVSKITRVLDSAGKKCMELLSAFYYDKLNMREISSKFNFSGERSATAQKHKCLEKVRSVVKQKSLAYEDFLE